MLPIATACYDRSAAPARHRRCRCLQRSVHNGAQLGRRESVLLSLELALRLSARTAAAYRRRSLQEQRQRQWHSCAPSWACATHPGANVGARGRRSRAPDWKARVVGATDSPARSAWLRRDTAGSALRCACPSAAAAAAAAAARHSFHHHVVWSRLARAAAWRQLLLARKTSGGSGDGGAAAHGDRRNTDEPTLAPQSSQVRLISHRCADLAGLTCSQVAMKVGLASQAGSIPPLEVSAQKGCGQYKWTN